MIALAVAVGWGTWHFSIRAGRPGRDIRNVLLISIDTCRADSLGCYGNSSQATPNVDALARDGVLFKSVITPFPMTLPAHCSMLTGTYPETHGVRANVGRLGDANVTLAKILRTAGYQTAAFVGGFPLAARFGLNQGFQTYDDQFHQGKDGDEPERKAEEVSRPAMAWLEEHGDQPFFLFLHYYDPHFPYDPPPPFPSTYAGEIAYVDMSIGTVMDKLRTLGLYDNTLVIVAGDHGEGLGEHGETEHGFFIYQSTLHVPLMVRTPKGRVKGSQVDENVSLVNIVPTVLGLAGLSIPRQVQGVDLSGYLAANSPTERAATALQRIAVARTVRLQPAVRRSGRHVEVHPVPQAGALRSEPRRWREGQSRRQGAADRPSPAGPPGGTSAGDGLRGKAARRCECAVGQGHLAAT